MVTLAIDTAFDFLNIVIFDEHKHVLTSKSEFAIHKQSEQLLPTIDALYQSVHLDPKDTGCIVLTQGPGSYTGLRIAMTFAKIMALFNHIELKVINTMDLYYGRPIDDGYCIMDARAKRVYMAHYTNGKRDQLMVTPIDALSIDPTTHVMGHGHLVGKTDRYPDFIDSFTYWYDHATPVIDPYQLAPLYLKESEAYGPTGRCNAQ